MPAEPPTLSAEQDEAAANIQAFIEGGQPGSYYVMHGLAGSGKTTVLGSLARRNPSAMLCTLTGKAADVLRRKTGAPCDTIHSTFYNLDEVWKRDDGREDMSFKARWGKGDLYGRVVLCDEVSQIATEMATDMLRTGCKIVAVGDPGQLPPVKGQQFFTKADVTLRRIHRQALDSPIIRQAHMVRLGRGYVADTDDFRVVRQPTPDDVREADIILCWRNVTRKACNAKMRTVRGYTAPHPQAGEPVMCLKNAPEYGVYNGGTYVLTADFRDGDDTIHIAVNDRDTVIPNVQFEDMPDGLFPGERAVTRFAAAYACTTHKSQGSEWDNVLLFDEYSMDEHRREWVYTSLTRAAKRITVVRR